MMNHLNIYKSIAVFFFAIVMSINVLLAQKSVKGTVQELETKAPMFGVIVENVNTQQSVMTDSFGQFEIEVAPNHLLEIKKFSYKTIKLRVPKGAIPKFYVLDMELELEELEEIFYAIDIPKHVVDSIKRTETYRSYINFYRKEQLNPVSDVFALVSKRNQQIWAFQKAFEYWEAEKFIDFMFNDELILSITELNKEVLPDFKEVYRPSYEFLKSFDSEYDYYNFIKRASQEYIISRRNFRN